jgi:hypothetical protein
LAGIVKIPIDARIVQDGVDVIENEWAAEAVAVGGDAAEQRQNKRRRPRSWWIFQLGH